MFTAVVLACSLETNTCAAFGGLGLATEADCYAYAAEVTVPTVMALGPDVVVVDMMCVAWLPEGEPV